MSGAAASLSEIFPERVPSATPEHGSALRVLAAQKKARPKARRVRGLRKRKLSADGAGLARRSGHRLAGLDHGGLQPSIGRAVGDARSNPKARSEERRVGRAARTREPPAHGGHD